MYSFRPVVLLALTLMLIGSPVVAVENYPLPTPAPMPKMPTVPEGEKQFLVWDGVVPGTRMWVQNMTGNVWHYGTTQSVGDGAGMYVFAPAGGPAGFLCAYDTAVKSDDFKGFKGISLWFKGDGSDGAAVISTGYAGSANRFRIPLRNTDWHKVFMPWDKWDQPITGPFWFLTFGLERRNDKRSGWYIIDRVHLFKEKKTEPIHVTSDNDPPGLLPAKAFITGRQNMAKTVAKLQAKKPVKIIISGDSIAAGAQLWYSAKPDSPSGSELRNVYFEVLGRSLMKYFGYRSAALVFRSYDGQKMVWTEKPKPRPAADLTVMTFAIGGGNAKDGLANIEQILNEKPDLVIWGYGRNDVDYGNLNSFLNPAVEAIKMLRTAGIEVIVQTITPGSDMTPKPWMDNKSPMEKGLAYNEELRQIAAENGCALADMERAFLSRGPQFTGDLYADLVHPNHMGHEMLADILDALITGRDVRIWKHGPAAGHAQAEVKKR